jgi:hypothetical protein
MRLIILIKATASTEAGVMPTEEPPERGGPHHEELADAVPVRRLG